MEKHYCTACGNHLITAIKVCPTCRGKQFSPKPTPAKKQAVQQPTQTNTYISQSTLKPNYHYCNECGNYLMQTIKVCPKCRAKSFSNNPPAPITAPPTQSFRPSTQQPQPIQQPYTPAQPAISQTSATNKQSIGFWSGVAGFIAIVEGIVNFIGYLIGALIVVGLLASNPTKQDFDQFLRKSIQNEIGQKDFISNFFTEAILIGAKEVTTRENFLFFSTYEIDISTFRLFASDLPPRLRFVGIGGQFIPLDKLK